ncbi:MobH family relaxase [Photobacterium iliopiscarium]|uniref:MobH family relaxase n=1 Tax=Photobacterium iliopiscarium TaxID=56192 RepID=UPI001E3CF0B1|nr:MobH family relaxase [Photobacterium iliopiscarium]MCD9485934.1 hypothetical protein [Photobacterium iliopiscarium]MCF2242631.1 hypothetical protein [Photobacterium iliopiscarium]
MGLKQIIHHLLVGAAGWLAPKRQDKDIEVDQYIDDLIKYPPTTKGVPLLSLNKIAASQSELISLTLRDSGLNDPFHGNDHDAVIAYNQGKSQHKIGAALDLNFDTLYRQVFLNYISYIHLLPASEAHHHSDVGGLVRHSLEVALNSLRQSYQQILPAVGQVDEEQYRKPRWQYAAWIVGLLHDAGKILFDMHVYDIATGVEWNPYLSDIYQWGNEHNVERYRVTWRAEHRHKKHENLSIQIIDWVLTPEAKSFLMDNSDELAIEMNHALTDYHTQDGYLQICLRKADSASTDKDIKTQWHDLIGKRRYPLEGVIVSAMRRLRDSWRLNEVNGNIWIIGGEVYLTYPRSIQAIISKLQQENTDVPAEVSRVLEILENRNLVKRLEPETSVSYFTPSIHIEGFSQPERVVKLAWPSLLFEGLPIPNSIPGLLRLNNRGKSIEFTLEGAVVEHLEQDEQIQSVDSNDQNAVSEKQQTSNDQNAVSEKQQTSNDQNAVSEKQQTSNDKPKPDVSETQSPSEFVDINTGEVITAVDPLMNQLSDIIPGLQKMPPRPTGNHGIKFHNQESEAKQTPEPPKTKQSPVPSKAKQAPEPPKTKQSPVPSKAKQAPEPPKTKQSPVPSKAKQAPEPPKTKQSPVPSVNQDAGNKSHNTKPKAKINPAITNNEKQSKASNNQAAKVDVCVLSNGLISRKRNTNIDKELKDTVETNWLNKQPDPNDLSAVFLTALVNKITDKQLLIENNDNIYLFKGYLIVTTKCIEELGISIRDISSVLRKKAMLLSDIDKPNIAVHNFIVCDKQQKCIVLSCHITRCIMMDVNQHIEHIKYPITILPAPLRKPYGMDIKKLTSKQKQKQNEKVEKVVLSSPETPPAALIIDDVTPELPIKSEGEKRQLPDNTDFSPVSNISKLNNIKPDSNLAAFIKWLNESWSSDCPFMQYTNGSISLDFDMARKEFRSQLKIGIRVKDIDCLRHESVQLISKTTPTIKKEFWVLKQGVITHE